MRRDPKRSSKADDGERIHDRIMGIRRSANANHKREATGVSRAPERTFHGGWRIAVIQRCNHVSITVKDLAGVIAWFRDKMGCTHIWPPYEYQGELISIR